VRTPNLVISIVLILFSAFYISMIIRLPDRNLPHTLGAQFVPWVLACCLVFLSLLLLLKGIFGTQDSESKPVLHAKDLGGILGLLVLIIFYIKAMDLFGFPLTTVFFLAALAFISGARSVLEILVFSIVTTAGVYLLFQQFFKVQLPAGQFF